MTIRPSCAVAVIALSLAGCDAVQPGNGLTREEAEALFTGVMAKSEVWFVVPDTVLLGCLGGGEWEVAAARTRWEHGDTLGWTVNYEIVPRTCVIVSEDLRFTVDGDPGLYVERRRTFVDGNLTGIAGTVSGDIGWLVDQRQGTCAMDLALDVEVGESSVDGTLKGLLCGHDVMLDAAPVLDLRLW